MDAALEWETWHPARLELYPATLTRILNIVLVNEVQSAEEYTSVKGCSCSCGFLLSNRQNAKAFFLVTVMTILIRLFLPLAT